MEPITLSVFKFLTIEDADDKMNFLNEYHGLPINGFESRFSSESYRQNEDYWFVILSPKWTSVLSTVMSGPEEIQLEQRP
jgi:hypothetical protein